MAKKARGLGKVQVNDKRERSSVNEDGPRKRVKSRAPQAENERPKTRLKVYVFGSGESGELGLGARVHNKKSPENIARPRLNHLLDPDSTGVVQVSAGGMHCAALTHVGQVLTWGVNDSKALGRDTTWTAPEDTDEDESVTDLNPLESTLTAVELGPIGSVVQVTATDNATFILTHDGKVYGWGTFFGDDGAYGFLKDAFLKGPKPKYDEKFATSPAQIPGLSNVKELAAGVNHMLALTHDGNLYSWGSGHQAELGRRLVPRRPWEALEPRLVPLPKNDVYSWGLNNFGQTGHPTSKGNLRIVTPVIVQNLAGEKIRHMAGGFHHSIACTEDGQVLTWGRCDDAQIGVDLRQISEDKVQFDSRGQPRIVITPMRVPGINATFVAAGIDNSLAITHDKQAFSWGFSESYRTGLATDDSVEEPTLLRGKDLGPLTFAGCGGQFSVVAGPA